MREDYLVSVTGNQAVEQGENTSVKVVTPGSYVTKGNCRYIIYREYSDENAGEFKKTVLKISDNNVITIIKGGAEQSRLVLEEGQRHSCYFCTDVGAFTIGIYTTFVECNLSDNGGTIKAKYYMDVNSVVISTNEIIINVKEKEIEKCLKQ